MGTILPINKSVILVKQHTKDVVNGSAEWHSHAELELIYIDNAKGKKHIGSHLSYFHTSQLILIGSNLPHIGFLDRFSSNGIETNIKFREDFLGTDILNVHEMLPIKNLFLRAKEGLIFGSEIKNKIEEKVLELNNITGLNRIILFLDILKTLATTSDYTTLNACGCTFEEKCPSNVKIETVFEFVRENYQRPIPLEEIASLIDMTVPAFCRYYKKFTKKTFTECVNIFRVAHASKLLVESDLSIPKVCHESGFNNISHFNKFFKSFTGISPLKYRKEAVINLSALSKCKLL